MIIALLSDDVDPEVDVKRFLGVLDHYANTFVAQDLFNVFQGIQKKSQDDVRILLGIKAHPLTTEQIEKLDEAIRVLISASSA